MRRLVITADDFGASVEVNEAVERAHLDGILTAASLMVTGAAVDDALARARRLPNLGVGLHLVLVEGRPKLPPAQIPDLTGADGNFRTDMVATSFAIALKASVRRQLAAEIDAQFAAFAATRLPLDHVNAHKHFHLHPMIATIMLRAAAMAGARSVRAPIEHGTRGIEGWWARRLQKKMRRAGMIVPDQVVGLAWSGAFDIGRMRSAIEDLRPGFTEIYTHPATADTYPGSAPGYRYRDELAALTDPVAKSMLVSKDILHGNFSIHAPAP